MFNIYVKDRFNAIILYTKLPCFVILSLTRYAWVKFCINTSFFLIKSHLWEIRDNNLSLIISYADQFSWWLNTCYLVHTYILVIFRDLIAIPRECVTNPVPLATLDLLVDQRAPWGIRWRFSRASKYREFDESSGLRRTGAYYSTDLT